MDSNSLVNFNIQRASRFVTKNELAPPFPPSVSADDHFLCLYFVLSSNLLGRRASLKKDVEEEVSFFLFFLSHRLSIPKDGPFFFELFNSISRNYFSIYLKINSL